MTSLRLLWLAFASLLLVACATAPNHRAAATGPAKPIERFTRARPPGAPRVGDDPMVIHTLPIGAGNCHLLQCPSENKLIVFDCGSTGAGDQNWDENDVQNYVNNLIDDDTDIVVTVSHANTDHYNYLPDLFADSDQVSTIAIGQQLGNYSVDFRNWVNDLTGNHNANLWWSAGQYSSNGNENWLSCWAPDGHGGWDLDVAGEILVVDAGATANDQSMVVQMDYQQFSTIFTGDMTGTTEHAITGGVPQNYHTSVLTGAHHGADTAGSNSASWALANSAEMVMFSSGTRHLHPRCDSVEVYQPYAGQADDHEIHCGDNGQYEQRDLDDQIFVTNDQGLIVIDANEDGSYLYDLGDAALAKSHLSRGPRGLLLDKTKAKVTHKPRKNPPPKRLTGEVP